MKNFFRRSAQTIEPAKLAVEPPSATKFERILASCKETGDFMPAWESFVNTQFFVSVITEDSGPQTSAFRFQLLQGPQDGKPCISISEHLQKLSVTHGQKAIKEIGAKIVAMLNPEVGIIIGLSDGGFGMPPDLVNWLRASIQSAKP